MVTTMLTRIIENYQYIVYDLADPRTNGYFLMNSPFTILFIVLAYVAYVKHFGIQFMDKREAYNLTTVTQVYNIVQILYCGLIVVKGYPTVVNLNWKCEDVNYSYDQKPLEVVQYGYLYFVLKIIDLFDTIIFVLRKKYSQITFLHVYHHCLMVFLSWMGLKYFAGGHSMYLPFINCVVHIAMYTYYLVSMNNKNVIWWKKHITQLQLLQFISFMVIYTQVLFRDNCNFPKALILVLMPQNFLMIIMFGSFYYNTYIKPNKRKD